LRECEKREKGEGEKTEKDGKRRKDGFCSLNTKTYFPFQNKKKQTPIYIK
jgi:hypothetical protein